MKTTGNKIIECAAAFLGLDTADTRLTDPIDMKQAYMKNTVNAVLIELSDFNRRLCGYTIAPSVITSFETEISCHELVGNILAPLRVAMLISIWYDRELYELLKSSYRDAYENAKKSFPSVVKHITEVY